MPLLEKVTLAASFHGENGNGWSANWKQSRVYIYIYIYIEREREREREKKKEEEETEREEGGGGGGERAGGRIGRGEKRSQTQAFTKILP
jgi:hypothetical protein